jgi:hypothetical protein
MALLAWWFVFQLGHGRGYFSAGVMVALTACLALVRPRRHWLYGIGAVMCLSTLALALWPTDPPRGSGLCGSQLYPHTDRDVIGMLAAEDGFDPTSYVQACDDERARNVRLVALGGLLTAVVVGGSIVPRGTRRGSDDRPSHDTHAPTT